MLIAFFTAMFLMGGGAAWQMPNLTKPIEQHVTNVAQRKTALDARSRMNEAVKEYGKFAAATGKQSIALIRNYDATEAQFAALTTRLDSGRVALRQKLLADRSAMRNAMTADEWTAVFAAARATADSAAAKAAAKQASQEKKP